MAYKACVFCGEMFHQHKSERYCSLKCAVMSRAKIGTKEECWEWQGAIASNGYGLFTFLSVYYTAHRASYIAHFGDVPPRDGAHGGVVMHSCDNRKCVNPYHLSVGSQKENLQDCNRKGRMKFGNAKGELARTSVLTTADVISIRERLRKGEKGAHLAREFKVTESAIHSIKVRKSWKHL